MPKASLHLPPSVPKATIPLADQRKARWSPFEFCETPTRPLVGFFSGRNTKVGVSYNHYETQFEELSDSLGLGLILLLWGVSAQAQPSFTSEEGSDDAFERMLCQLSAIREAGIARDKTQTERLLTTLRTPSVGAAASLILSFGYNAPTRIHFQNASLVALSRIASEQSLAPLEQLREDPNYRQLPHLEPTIARIKVELAFPHPKTQAEWLAKVQMFMTLSEVTVADFARLTTDPETKCKRELEKAISHIACPSKEEVCLRYLAEMASVAYAGGYRQAFEDLARQGIDLSNDFVANLIMQIAVRSPQQRVEWLVHQLKSLPAVRRESLYLLQALADCGSLGLRAVLDWLEELKRADMEWERVEVDMWHCVMALSAFRSTEAKNALRNLVSERPEIPSKLGLDWCVSLPCACPLVSDY